MSVSNHADTKVLRKGFKKSMRGSPLAEALMLLINTLRKRFTAHPSLLSLLFSWDDLWFILMGGVSNHSLLSRCRKHQGEIQ